MSQSTITAKGQTTIPQDIRQHLRLKPGDRVVYIKEPHGRVRIVAKNVKLDTLAGMLKSDRSATIEEMNEAIAEEAAEQYRRSVEREQSR